MSVQLLLIHIPGAPFHGVQTGAVGGEAVGVHGRYLLDLCSNVGDAPEGVFMTLFALIRFTCFSVAG